MTPKNKFHRHNKIVKFYKRTRQQEEQVRAAYTRAEGNPVLQAFYEGKGQALSSLCDELNMEFQIEGDDVHG